jgi:hypothetical protein
MEGKNMSEGELKKRLTSTFVFGIVHQKPLSIEVQEILDEVKADFPIQIYSMEPQFQKKLSHEGLDIQETERFEIDLPTVEETIKLIKWFLKWFGENK